MPLCSYCRSEYVKGKKICSYCGEELYKGLMTDLPDEEDTINETEWTRVTSAGSEFDADIVLKQLIASNIPAVKRDSVIPFEDVNAVQSESIEIYVPQEMEQKARDILS